MAAEVTVMQPRMVVGVFDDHADAVEALQELKDVGFEPDQVSIVMLQAPQPEGEAPQRFHVDGRTGILAGGVLGGFLAGELGFGQVNGFIAAVIVAVLGSLLVRLVINALDR